MQEDIAYYSPDLVVDYFRQQDYDFVKTESCWWFNEYRQKSVYFAFPTHRQVIPSTAEIKQIFRRLPSAMALRFISPPDGVGKASCLWVRRRPYDLNELEKKSRNQTRRGLEYCGVRQLSFAELIEKGWEAHADTLNRHGEQAYNLGINRSLDDIPAFKAWGAFIDDMLTAYIVVQFIEDWATILVARSASSSLKYYPNNALVFQVVLDLLHSGHVNTVSYGWDSLVPNPGLEQFKLGMGFEKEPVKQRIVIRPFLRILLNKFMCRLIINVIPRGLKNNRVQKLLGLCEVLIASY